MPLPALARLSPAPASPMGPPIVSALLPTVIVDDAASVAGAVPRLRLLEPVKVKSPPMLYEPCADRQRHRRTTGVVDRGSAADRHRRIGSEGVECAAAGAAAKFNVPATRLKLPELAPLVLA